MWKTRITELLGIDYPIIQGAMAYISESQLAASFITQAGPVSSPVAVSL